MSATSTYNPPPLATDERGVDVRIGAYLPPISWFANLVDGEPFFIEAHEHYHKQTIRNRCTIDSPNGPLSLTIPVDKSNFVDGKCKMRDVRISHHSEWQRQHWYALESTYFNSPFFEYLQDDFRPFYEREWTFLLDLNEALIHKCLELIDLRPTMLRTETYIGTGAHVSTGTKKMDKEQSPYPLPRYYQMFSHKHGFLPDLSIIDLIFNLGPEALLYLKGIKNVPERH